MDFGYHSFNFEIVAGKSYGLRIQEKRSNSKMYIQAKVNGRVISDKKVFPTYKSLTDVEIHYGSPDYLPADVEISRFYYG
jgi:hypothetical protein